ncbi:MAG: hypothetical protein J7L10_06145 [Methanomicrobia archaeon]|nr:hypothetical protein [Methanomicrobia archaeon]RLF93838.1 MAG: hypothetical protein DRN50_06565 [Thermococci archaeon]
MKEREKIKARIRTKKTKKLDMNRIKDFKWELDQILKDLPDSVKGNIKGSIYAKASKLGIKETKDFIMQKEEEGTISEEMGRKIVKLLYRYNRYRS